MTTEDIGGMIGELMADDSGKMTAWELDFVEGMSLIIYDANGNIDILSDQRKAKVSQIWHRLFG